MSQTSVFDLLSTDDGKNLIFGNKTRKIGKKLIFEGRGFTQKNVKCHALLASCGVMFNYDTLFTSFMKILQIEIF